MLNLKEGIGNKGKALSHKPFTLYNAGLYDFSQLKKLPWGDWRFFALNLFQCQDQPHKIGGIAGRLLQRERCACIQPHLGRGVTSPPSTTYLIRLGLSWVRGSSLLPPPLV
jgi:hypothetical protein